MFPRDALSKMESWALRWPQGQRLCQLLWPSASESEQALCVPSRGRNQGFGVDLLKRPRPEAAHAVPELTLREQRLYPHLALQGAQRLEAFMSAPVHRQEVSWLDQRSRGDPFLSELLDTA